MNIPGLTMYFFILLLSQNPRFISSTKLYSTLVTLTQSKKKIKPKHEMRAFSETESNRHPITGNSEEFGGGTTQCIQSKRCSCQ